MLTWAGLRKSVSRCPICLRLPVPWLVFLSLVVGISVGFWSGYGLLKHQQKVFQQTQEKRFNLAVDEIARQVLKQVRKERRK